MKDQTLSGKVIDFFLERMELKGRYSNDSTEIDKLDPSKPKFDLIMEIKQDTTESQSLFYHLRNSIAHGRFDVTNNTFTGFDYRGHYNFFIRINADKLNETLHLLLHDVFFEH